MDDLDGLDFDEGDFQVLDECLEEEDDEEEEKEKDKILRNNKKSKLSLQNLIMDNEKNNDKDVESDDNLTKEKDEQVSSADVSLEQFDDHDVIVHLNEIENIVLDAESFGLQIDDMNMSTASQRNDEKNKNDEQDVILLEEENELDDLTIISSSPKKKDVKENKIEEKEKKTDEKEKKGEEIEKKKDESEKKNKVDKKNENEKRNENEKKVEKSLEKNYKDRLEKKVEIVKEKFKKLANVLNKSYPVYNHWLKRVETENKSPVCRMDSPRCCPSDRQQTNRWKFICTRKPLDESADKKTEGDDNADVTVDNKLLTKTVWRLGPSEGSVDNANTAFKSYPEFIMRPAKIFEDFINGLSPENSAIDKKPYKVDEKKDQWLFLLIRANSKNELLLFATGKEIDKTTIEGLKKLFDTGIGKDCNVKSLYCKTIGYINNTSTTTTFLLGSESLDDKICGIKIKLPPKTNFSSSAIGAELLGKAVEDLLGPDDKTSVVEIGCGLGLISLMIASKCEKVLGYDSLSDIEEAEVTLDLNRTKNAEFITGPSDEAIGTIATSLRNCKSSAIVNTNTKVGRDIEILTGLRKISSLRKVVTITTMTKQSIRSIIELMKPADDVLGNPFMPMRSIIVDTMPNGQFFEVAILMERRVMHKLLRPYNEKLIISPTKSIESCSSPLSIQSVKKTLSTTSSSPKIISPIKPSTKKPPSIKEIKIIDNKKKSSRKRDDDVDNKKLVKNPFHSGSKQQRDVIPLPILPSTSSRRKRQRNRSRAKSNRSISPLPLKRKRDDIDKIKNRTDTSSSSTSLLTTLRKRDNNTSDLRSRLKNNRSESTDLIPIFQQSKQILDDAIKELKNPIIERNKNLSTNLAVNKLNEVQFHLSRSVWDRIAPVVNNPQTINDQIPNINNDNNCQALKGSIVHEQGKKNFVIMTPNHEFLESRDKYRKYFDVPIAEPNQILPNEYYIVNKQNNDQGNLRNHEDWPSRRGLSPNWRNERVLPLKRPLLSPPRRGISPQKSRRPLSPQQQQRRYFSPPRQLASSVFRPRVDKVRRDLSPPRRNLSPIRRNISPVRKNLSPPPQQQKQQPRQLSPPRRLNLETRQNYEPMIRGPGAIPRQMIIPRSGGSPPPRVSPPRRSPIQLIDDWDIPSRGAIEQHGNWQRQKSPQPLMNWETTKRNDNNYRKPVNNQELDYIELNNYRDNNWKNQAQIATGDKQQQQQQNNWDNRWAGPGSNGQDNWNIRDKDTTFTKPSNSRDDSWNERPDGSRGRWIEQSNLSRNWNQGDKEDWNDLPEDARDPWGDDGGSGNKERWQNSTQGWTREKSDDWNSGGACGNSGRSGWQKSVIVNPQQAMNPWAGGGGGGNSGDNAGNKINQPGTGWVQQDSGGNNWRSNFTGSFPPPQQQQQQRSFNTFNDGR